jgi:multidrug efflux system outer membrane protein
LLAAEDVESTLVRFSEQQNQLEMLTTAERESLRSVELSHVLYDKGLKDFLTVLDAERVLTEVRDRLVQSETAVVLHMIGLYKALGGGWQTYEKIDEVADIHKSGAG